MAEKPSDLSFIRDAAQARRRVRRDLRESARRVATDLAEVLRVGDAVEIVSHNNSGLVVYSITKLRWWGVPEGIEDASWVLSNISEGALVRHSPGRACVLTDPRSTFYDDYGNPFEPVGRELEAVDDPLIAAGTAVGLAVDAELIAFSLEASTVSEAFAASLADELKQMERAVAGLQAFRGELS